MKRRVFLKKIGFGAAAVALSGCTAPIDTTSNQPKKKPNIILFYIDDLGYADVGYHGCKDVPTPQIDSIAQNGAWFSAAYVTAPVCGPSRAGLLTGRYQQRFGFEDNPAPGVFCQTPDMRVGLPETEKTLGQRLQPLGYKTAFIGKHHSGQRPRNNPVNRGFDFFFGFDNGASEYFFHDYKQKTPERLLRGLETVQNEPEYYTDAFGREAVSFIQRNKDNPFFLYVPFNAVHGPMQAPQELIDKYKHIPCEGRRKLAAMLDSTDTNIGKVLDTVRTLGLEDDTIIIFISDNGGDEERSNFSYNKPFRDKKRSLYEGGIRVPFCVQWKNTISPGQRFDFPVHTLDIMTTAMAATDSPIRKSWRLDGINLLPYLQDKKKSPPKRYLYWRFLYSWAIRDDQWKLVQASDQKVDQYKPELFHITTDLSETNNVIDKYPEVAERLQKAWNQWNATLMEPQWGTIEELCGSHIIPM